MEKHLKLACPGSTPRSGINCGIYPPLGSLETTRLLIYTYFTVFTARTESSLTDRRNWRISLLAQINAASLPCTV